MREHGEPAGGPGEDEPRGPLVPGRGGARDERAHQMELLGPHQRHPLRLVRQALQPLRAASRLGDGTEDVRGFRGLGQIVDDLFDGRSARAAWRGRRERRRREIGRQTVRASGTSSSE